MQLKEMRQQNFIGSGSSFANLPHLLQVRSTRHGLLHAPCAERKRIDQRDSVNRPRLSCLREHGQYFQKTRFAVKRQ